MMIALSVVIFMCFDNAENFVEWEKFKFASRTYCFFLVLLNSLSILFKFTRIGRRPIQIRSYGAIAPIAILKSARLPITAYLQR